MTARKTRRPRVRVKTKGAKRQPERFGPLQGLLTMLAVYMVGQTALAIWLPHLSIPA